MEPRGSGWGVLAPLDGCRMTHDRPLFGIALMLGFCVTAPLIDVFSKLATEQVSVGQITAARFLFQGLIMLPVVLALGHGLRVSPRLLPALALRGFFLAASTFAFVSAVTADCRCAGHRVR